MSSPTQSRPSFEIVSSSEDVDDTDTKQSVGEEVQCEEVDMNNPRMDPLEWSVRKTVSIPKKYYWETGNYDVSFRTKAWHRSIQTMGITLRCAEKIGEVATNILGLNSSRFSDVTDFMTDEEWKEAKKRAEEDKAKRIAFEKEKEEQNVV